MFYQDQSILLATKHHKEKAIAPVFSEYLACQICTQDFDTDQFGTFTGEIARTASAYETCLQKATTAAVHYGFELALANEGSFGPHPHSVFMPCDHEIMVFIDRKNDWIISEQIMSAKTNYQQITLEQNTDLEPFLQKVGFPEHGLVLQTEQGKKIIEKGINHKRVLGQALQKGFSEEKRLCLSTDMRAMMNPTRMKLISELALKLVQRIITSCPSCHAPGFGFVKIAGNLLCQICANPTSLYENEIYGCVRCTHEERHLRKDHLLVAEPYYCSFCNP